jgi:hypothetical protein
MVDATSECADAVLMIWPQPRCFMPGVTARIAWNAEERLIAMTASHFSTEKSSIGETCWMPAWDYQDFRV